MVQNVSDPGHAESVAGLLPEPLPGPAGRAMACVPPVLPPVPVTG